MGFREQGMAQMCTVQLVILYWRQMAVSLASMLAKMVALCCGVAIPYAIAGGRRRRKKRMKKKKNKERRRRMKNEE